MITNIMQKAENINNEIISWRRSLHKIPECGYELPKTLAFVEARLREFGIEDIRLGVGKSGIVADIWGAKGEGKTVAFRADMDALPINEDNDLPFCSEHPGKMHACGHDGHTAILLGMAKLAWNERENFRGRVRLIFQPAEEGMVPGGAESMIADGALEGVDAIFGCHLVPIDSLPLGSMFYQKGLCASAVDRFKIELFGRGGHGSAPQDAVDAVTLAAQVVNNIQHIISRQTDPRDMLCITIGSMHAGSAANVIAETAELNGTMRSYRESVRQKALKDIERCVKAACDCVGAKYSFTHIGGIRALICEEKSTELMAEVSRELLGAENTVLMPEPGTASDDFADFLNEIPGAYFQLACCSGYETSYPPHSPQYRMDDSVLKFGSALYLGIADRFLNGAEK